MLMFTSQMKTLEFLKTEASYPGWVELNEIDYVLQSLIDEYEQAKRELIMYQNEIESMLEEYL